MNAAIQEKDQSRVLIVDDDPDILSSLKTVLELEDLFLVATCTTDTQAKTIAGEFLPDIVLLDVNLGSSSGLDLVPYMKDHIPDAACIIMTAYRDVKYAVQAVQFGADDYIHKPVDSEKFIKTMGILSRTQKLKREKRISDLRFKALFEQTFQSIFFLDMAGVILDANETAAINAGTGKDSLTGLNIREISIWKDSAENSELLHKCLLEPVIRREEFSYRGADNQIRCLDCVFKKLSYDSHMEDIIILECRDITDLKNIENQLKNTNEILEQKVIERTRDYKEARDRAESASRSKTEFLARMSHELKTPLNAIMGFGQLLNEDKDSLNDLQLESVGQILSAGKRLLQMINDVLDLAKLESGFMEMELSGIDLNVTLQSCIELIRRQAEMKNITIQDKASSAGYIVLADQLHLKQSLLNLLKNAVRYNREGGSVIVESGKMANGMIRITIQDTGIGIDLQEQSTVFDSFERAGKNKSVEGTGIGLALTRRLVELMKGNIGFSSKPGEGSSFWIELPEDQ